MRKTCVANWRCKLALQVDQCNITLKWLVMQIRQHRSSKLWRCEKPFSYCFLSLFDELVHCSLAKIAIAICAWHHSERRVLLGSRRVQVSGPKNKQKQREVLPCRGCNPSIQKIPPVTGNLSQSHNLPEGPVTIWFDVTSAGWSAFVAICQLGLDCKLCLPCGQLVLWQMQWTYWLISKYRG